MKKLDLKPIEELRPNREPVLDDAGKPRMLDPVAFLTDQCIPIAIEGMSAAECAKRLKLIDKLLDHAGRSHVLLEGEDHALLQKAFGATKWSVASRAIVTLHERIEKAEEVQVKEVVDDDAGDEEPEAEAG
jgi:hypothetical protein